MPRPRCSVDGRSCRQPSRRCRRFLEAAEVDDAGFAACLWVLAATGCRRGEACALRWTDVDLERCEVAIRRSISQVDREVREKDTKTHQSRRVAIDEQTVAVLRSALLPHALRSPLCATTAGAKRRGEGWRRWGQSSATDRSAGLDVVTFGDVGETALVGELIMGDGVKELST